VGGNPKLLRRRGRRGSRRAVVFSALIGMLLVAPGATAVSQQIVITPEIVGTLGANNWYTSNVTVRWRYNPEPLETRGCDFRTLTADTAGTTLSCSATLDLITWVTVDRTFKVDKTRPSITGAFPARPPDANGWYNHAVAVAFSGFDAMSGLESCSSVQYAGPDNGAATVGGLCRDLAGNQTDGSFSLKYDATPPSLVAVTAKLGNRSAQLSWRKSADTQVVEVLRAPGRKGQGETVVYRGSETGFRDTGLVVGRKYEYRVTGFDQAANRSDHTIEIVARGALLNPAPGAHVTSPPTLAWTPVRKASYYNLQLIRGRKVLSVWTLRPSFQMRRAWIYKGRRYRMKPGVYRWFVWPGFGRIKAANYGRLLGSSTFVVVGKAPRR
jgi:hypothetical protein